MKIKKGKMRRVSFVVAKGTPTSKAQDKETTISNGKAAFEHYWNMRDGPLIDKRDPSFFLNPIKCYRYFSRDDIPDGQISLRTMFDNPMLRTSRLLGRGQGLSRRFLHDTRLSARIAQFVESHEDDPSTIKGIAARLGRRISLRVQALVKDQWPRFRRFLRRYFHCWAHKLRLLCYLTLGVWNDELAKNMEIEGLAQHFDWDVTDDVSCQDQTLTNIGIGHSLIWQFLPGCVVLAKLGEASNESPAFVSAKMLRLADDWQTRSIKWIMFILEFFCTLAIACNPNIYWFGVASLVTGFASFSEASPPTFELLVYAILAKPFLWLIGLPGTPSIVSVKQLGYAVRVTFRPCAWSPFGGFTRYWNGSNSTSHGFEIMVHPQEVGVPRMHLKPENLVPSHAARGEKRLVSIMFPLRGTTNFREDDDKDEPVLLPPPFAIGSCHGLQENAGGLITAVPDGLEAGQQISIRVAACNSAGHGLFSRKHMLELRTPLREDYDEASRERDEHQIVVAAEDGDSEQFWGQVQIQHHDSMDEEAAQDCTLSDRCLRHLHSAENSVLDPFARGLSCLFLFAFVVFFITYRTWEAAQPPKRSPSPTPSPTLSNTTNKTTAPIIDTLPTPLPTTTEWRSIDDMLGMFSYNFSFSNSSSYSYSDDHFAPSTSYDFVEGWDGSYSFASLSYDHADQSWDEAEQYSGSYSYSYSYALGDDQFASLFSYIAFGASPPGPRSRS